MATATALRSAARQLSRSASSIVAREVTGHHNLTIDGYRATRKLPNGWSAASTTFEAAGYTWRVRYHPNNNSWTESIDLYLEPVHGGRHGPDADRRRRRLQDDDPVQFRFSLLDRDGIPVPEFTRSKELCFFNARSPSKGFPSFIRWKDLEESGCLDDDRFTVRCDVTVIKSWTETAGAGEEEDAPPAPRVAVPPSDLHQHLNALLWKKQGTDVTIDVGGGEACEAHGWLLAARSPVLEAELLAAAKEKVPGGGVRRRLEVQGVEPSVFRALLHFVYTDALPEIQEREAVATARGLLAAAHRYKLERLRLMCEETLCQRIGVDTVAGTLAVAEHNGCQALKAACMEFIARPGNLKAVMETQEFEKIKANCPNVMMELVMKHLAE